MRFSPRFLLFAFGLSLNVVGATAATYHVERLTADLHIPVQAQIAPGFNDKIFVAQLGGRSSDGTDGNDITKAEGRIVVYDRTTGQVDYQNPFLTISDTSLLEPYGVPEIGLFSFAFHPDFATNGKLYVNVAVNHTGSAPVVDTRVSPLKTVVREYTVNVANPALPVTSSRTILELNQPAPNHNGSWLGFNPLESAEGDNYLYITQGDGGDQHDPANYGQNPNNWFGTVMRIDVDSDAFAGDPARNYAIPSDNPFVGGGGAPEVWAYGLRNPWRASFDSTTGDFYIGDVGQGYYEEVNFIAGDSPGGQNFGWRLREGAHPTPTGGVGGPAPPGAVDPIYEYLHPGRPGAIPDFSGSSITGGVMYRGPVQELQGRYIFADNVSGHIWSLDPDDPSESVQLMDSLFTPDQGEIYGVTSFDFDQDGNLLIVDGAGQLFALVPNVAVTLTVDRETGSMQLGNFTGDALDIRSYELTSASGAIEPTLLTPIAGNFDASMSGDGSVDGTNAWQVVSAPGDHFGFAEQSTGTATTLSDHQSFSLSAADGWIPSPTEDLALSITLGDGSTLNASVQFFGNGDSAYDRSDLDFDGQLDSDDWVIFNANHLSSLAGLSPAQQYGSGDLDGDGDNDFDDFRLFKADYIAALGASAFAELTVQVPEPTGLALAFCGMLGIGWRLARRCGRSVTNCQ